MSKRFLKPLLVVLCATVAAFVAFQVHAGGWATITVADLPDHFVAGKATNLTFTVRQHGVRLMDDLTPSLEAVQGQDKATATVTRDRTNYHAQLTLPKPGAWTITMKSSFGTSDVTLPPIEAVAANVAAKPLAQAERGRRLYAAKGCIGCHQHEGSGAKGGFPVAPNLTNKHYGDAYLTQLLADPKKVLASSKNMPNLNLKPQEIAALVAFINAGKKTDTN